MEPCCSTEERENENWSGNENGDRRRTLLVIYIHGFMGGNSSFQSFPAHIHDFLKISLDTHVINTKIYPRYKTYKAIDLARDNFSKWLAPHESPTTDIILVGHSMGGLLAADVVLLSPQEEYDSRQPRFRHRILGVLSLDSPFLGLHPGIISAGIASLFRKDPQKSAADGPPTPDLGGKVSPDPSIYNELMTDSTPVDSPMSSSTALSYFPSHTSNSLNASISSFTTNSTTITGDYDSNSGAVTPTTSTKTTATTVTSSDPSYNPPFFNDVLLKERSWVKNMLHFAKKRKIEGSSLIEAATNHIVCHMQFGKCLADHKGLHDRYHKIRRLEDVDDLTECAQDGPGPGNGNADPRVRFMNYYTISTGRVKTPKNRSPARTPSRSPARTPTRSPARSAPNSPPPECDSLESESPETQQQQKKNEIGARPAPRRRSMSEPRPPPTVAFLAPGQLGAASASRLDPPDSNSSTPRISIEDHSDTARPKVLEVIYSDRFDRLPRAPDGSPSSPADAVGAGPSDPYPTTTDNSGGTMGNENSPERPATGVGDGSSSSMAGLEQGLKPIPDLPPAPQPPKLSIYATDEERKKSDKEHKKALKEHEQAVKAHDKAVKEREKTIDKRRKKAENEVQKREKEQQKRQQDEDRKREKEEQKRKQDEERKRKKEQQKIEKEKQQKEKKKKEQGAAVDDVLEEVLCKDADCSTADQVRESPKEVDDCDACFEEAQREAEEDGAPRADGRDPRNTKDEEEELRRAAERVVTGIGSTTSAGSRSRQQQQGQKAGGSSSSGQKTAASAPAADNGGNGGNNKQQKKPRKFCTLPKKVDGVRDGKWQEVYMEGVDEIGAHTGLFSAAAPHYEKLVGEVGSTILSWVQEEASRRAILER